MNPSNSWQSTTAYIPFIYDTNDTGYYLNPNGTTGLNAVVGNVYDSAYAGGNSGLGRCSYPYAFGFQETGGWGYPYPDLVVQYHTGLTFAANASYQGMRFKADYCDDTLIFQINGGSNYIYKYRWMYTGDGAEGIYTGYNGAHFYPNNGTSNGAVKGEPFGCGAQPRIEHGERRDIPCWLGNLRAYLGCTR